MLPIRLPQQMLSRVLSFSHSVDGIYLNATQLPAWVISVVWLSAIIQEGTQPA